MGAKKFDDDKLRLDLVPVAIKAAIARALGFGAKKYGRLNYRSGDGLEWTRIYGAFMRHVEAYHEGEELDPESGLCHLDHAAACLAMWKDMKRHGKGIDDRPIVLHKDHDLIEGINEYARELNASNDNTADAEVEVSKWEYQ